MRAPRDVLKHVCVEIAERRRKCHRDKNHSISKGEKCLVVVDGSFGGSKNYDSVQTRSCLPSQRSTKSWCRSWVARCPPFRSSRDSANLLQPIQRV